LFLLATSQLVTAAGLPRPRHCRAAAEHLLPLLARSRFKGVCYFDEGDGVWTIADLQGRRMPRHSSPILESQAFTIFDEARCRGADLQLRPDAVGVVTLGPTTSKDKLMQAAGRLRRLGKGQTLRIAGTADVTAKVLAVASDCGAAGPPAGGGGGGGTGEVVGSRDVLQWVMHNTVQATQHGLLEWSHQGLLFAATRGAPERALQPEVLGLEELYGGGRRRRPVAAVVREQCDRRRQSCGGRLAGDMSRVMGDIVQRSERYRLAVDPQ
jgi:hypothetical protein